MYARRVISLSFSRGPYLDRAYLQHDVLYNICVKPETRAVQPKVAEIWFRFVLRPRLSSRWCQINIWSRTPAPSNPKCSTNTCPKNSTTKLSPFMASTSAQRTQLTVFKFPPANRTRVTIGFVLYEACYDRALHFWRRATVGFCTFWGVLRWGLLFLKRATIGFALYEACYDRVCSFWSVLR